MEKATHRGGRDKRPIEEIPELRKHLKRAGKTLAQFEAEQPRPDLNSESLSLARRKLSLTKRK